MILPLVTLIGWAVFSNNQLTLVILSKALYDKRDSAFDNNPVGLKFYKYDTSQQNNKGGYLGTD